ncbi:MAG: hypothetical protein AB1758_04625 [Candidatus Eremiobacterota bacterium]
MRLILLMALLSGTLGAQELVVGYASKDTLNYNLIATYERGRGWRTAEESRVGARLYTAYALDGKRGMVEGSPPLKTRTWGIAGQLDRKLPSESVLLEGNPPALRPATEVDRAEAATVDAVTAFLAGKGVAVPRARLSQNVSVDLDGDGRSERVVVASSTDYALLAVVTGVQVTPLRLVTTGVYWRDHRVLLVADLDGQGGPEVVERYEVHEGYGVVIYGQDGDTWKAMTRSDWGL